MSKDFDKLQFEVNATGNAQTVLNKIAESLKKIKDNANINISSEKSGSANQKTSSINKEKTSIETLQKTYENLRKEMERLAKIDLFKRDGKSVKNAIALNDPNYERIKSQELLINAEKKRIDSELSLGLGIREPKVGENGYEEASLIKQLNAELEKQVSLRNRLTPEMQKATKETAKLKAQVDKLDQSNKKVNKSTSFFSSTLGKLATIAFSARTAGRLFTSLIKESAAYIENLNLFAVTFGETYKETLDWSLDLAENFGIASNEVVRFTGLFKQLSTAIGVTGETGDVMSKVLTQLGLDLASFYNTTVQQAMEKLQAGIYAGQTKPLRSLGLDITEQTINNLLKTNEALQQFDTTSRQLDQSQKAIARTIIVLQSGQNAFGDMSATINTLSNQIKVFQGSLSNLKLALGDALAEPIRRALIWINGLIIAITDIIRAFVPIEDTSDTFRNGLSNIADEAELADKAVNNALLSFDKFSVLGESDASDGGDLSITQALTEELEKQQKIYEEQLASMTNINNQALQVAKTIKDWFIITDESGGFMSWTSQAKGLGFVLTIITTIPIIKFLEKITSMLYGTNAATKVLLKSLKSLLANPIILAITAIAGLFVYMYKTNEDFANSIKNLGKSFLPILNSIIEILKSLQPVLDIIVKITASAIDMVGKTLAPIIDLLADIITFLDDIGILLPIISIALFGPIVSILAIIKELDKLTTAFKKSFDWLVKNVFNPIGNFFVVLWKNILNGFSNMIKTISNILISFINTAIDALNFLITPLDFIAGIFGKNISIPKIDADANWQPYSISGFAQGGITNANLIMTHENGVREWVGKQGNSTAVVNNSQMTDVMFKAVRQGVMEGFAAMSTSDNSVGQDIILKIDGKELAKANVKNTANALNNNYRISLNPR